MDQEKNQGKSGKKSGILNCLETGHPEQASKIHVYMYIFMTFENNALQLCIDCTTSYTCISINQAYVYIPFSTHCMYMYVDLQFFSRTLYIKLAFRRFCIFMHVWSECALFFYLQVYRMRIQQNLYDEVNV